MTDLCVTCNHHHAEEGDTECRRCLHRRELAKARKALAGDDVILRRTTVEDALFTAEQHGRREVALERGMTPTTERVIRELKAALNEGEQT